MKSDVPNDTDADAIFFPKTTKFLVCDVGESKERMEEKRGLS
jgi:hypothetical protein